MTVLTYSDDANRKPETLSEAVVDLHDSLKHDAHENMTPCILDKSQIGHFFRLFTQRRWSRASCKCFEKVQGPVDAEYSSSYYVKCRHLTRWERAHANTLQQFYSHVKALSLWNQDQDRPYVSYDKFLMYAYAASAACSCDELVHNYSHDTSERVA